MNCGIKTKQPGHCTLIEYKSVSNVQIGQHNCSKTNGVLAKTNFDSQCKYSVAIMCISVR